MDISPLQCIQYNPDTLAHIILYASTAQALDTVKNRTQFKYLVNYLDDTLDDTTDGATKKPFGLCAKTMVIESGYVDQHYLEDFASYYAKSFQETPKSCVRIHFFSPVDLKPDPDQIKVKEKKADQTVESFTLPELRQGLLNEEKLKKCREKYLGYIVIRPIPNEYLAKICLACVPSVNQQPLQNKRVITRSVPVSLLGHTFSVDTIPMIEQDRVVAACASSAIWTFLSTLPHYPIHRIPALSTITQMALTTGGPAFPTIGLDTNSIIAAIHKVGAQPKRIPFDDTTVYKEQFASKLANFKQNIHAYLTTHSAVLLGITVYQKALDENGAEVNVKAHDENSRVVSGPVYQQQGYHTLCITGYRVNKQKATALKLAAASNYISHLYLHDDKFGPYLKLNLNCQNDNPEFAERWLQSSLTSEPTLKPTFSYDQLRKKGGSDTSQGNDGAVTSKEIFTITNIITGLDPVVRLPFDVAHDSVKTIIWSSPKANNIKKLPKLSISTSLRLSTELKGKLRKHLNEKTRESSNSGTKKLPPFYYYSVITHFPEPLPSKKEDAASYTSHINDVLETNFPKFVWRVRLRKQTKDIPLFCDFLFDATALPHKSHLIAIITYTDKAKQYIDELQGSFKKPETGSTKKCFYTMLHPAAAKARDSSDIASLQGIEQFFKELTRNELRSQLSKDFGSLCFPQRKMKGNELKEKPTINTFSTNDDNLQLPLKFIFYNATPYGGDGTTGNPRYIKIAWLINEQGQFIYMYETHDMARQQGHIALADNLPSRIAGELICVPEANGVAAQYFINTKSGAFSTAYYPDTQGVKTLLNNVLGLLKSRATIAADAKYCDDDFGWPITLNSQ
jgi:hypothetical protein